MDALQASNRPDSYFTIPHKTIVSPDSEHLQDSSSEQNETSTGSETDVKCVPADYAKLHLSGNLISATVCIPYELGYASGRQWQITPRRGTSALFDSFVYFSSSSAWNHTVVGWTGEILPARAQKFLDVVASTNPSSQGVKSSQGETNRKRPILSHFNKSAEPVLAKASAETTYNPKTHVLKIGEHDRKALQERSYNSGHCGKIVPAWLGELDASKQDLYLTDQGRWRRYAEKDLYPVLHYGHQSFVNDEKRSAEWVDYVNLNQTIADATVRSYKPGDIIHVHDYHLMLVPGMIRQQLPNAYITFFLHVPFPSSEYVRELPQRSQLLSGMLGADTIAFQTAEYAAHFGESCKDVLDLTSSARTVIVSDVAADRQLDSFVKVGMQVLPHPLKGVRYLEAVPIGIAANIVRKNFFGDPTLEDSIRELRRMYSGIRIIIGRDRLESVRGVSQKLEAFEKFLDLYPRWRKKVVLIQITGLNGASDERKDPKYESKVASLVARINGKYGSINHEPVIHYPQYFSSRDYAAVLRLADVGLVTSIRDGMNTTALEFVIAQEGSHSPLMLSEFSGTALNLPNALRINPWNYRNVADRLHECLTMTAEEKSAHHASLHKFVMANNVSHWAESLVKTSCDNLVARVAESEGALTQLSANHLHSAYLRSSHFTRVFLFDYDGTLTPITNKPECAIPSPSTIAILNALASNPQNKVWIISGRDQAFLQKHLGNPIPALGLSAEHGCFMRPPRTSTSSDPEAGWINLAETMDMSWQEAVSSAFEKITNEIPGSWIERKKVALTWHYREAEIPQDQCEQRARECKNMLTESVMQKWQVDVISGKCNLEVRVRDLNKGSMAKRIISDAVGRTVDGKAPAPAPMPMIKKAGQEIRYANAGLECSKDGEATQTFNTASSDDEVNAEVDEANYEGNSDKSGLQDKIPFVLCVGDDQTDEDMFGALLHDTGPDGVGDIELDGLFTVTVGPRNKQTLSRYYLEEVKDVIAILEGVVALN